MRQSFRRFVLAALLVSASSLAAAAEAAPKVGLLLKGRSAFWTEVEKGAKDAAAKAGVELSIKAPMAETDIGVQVQMLNALAAQGAEAIIIAPSSKEALAVPLASLAVKGVKIVVIDTPIANKTASTFVGTDQHAAGAAAGRLLATLVDDAQEVALLRHTQSGGATGQREIGALGSFRAVHPKNVVHSDIYVSAEPGKETEKAQFLLSQYPNARAILASSTPGTLTMLKVLQGKNLAGKIKLVGFGFNLNPEVAAAIESGALSGWVAQLPREVGAKSVMAAHSLLKGETVPDHIYTDFVLVTKENLQEPKVQALLAR
ncbi:MAG TPA: substrate-binding domain-containing protein [Opitutaceae bacterium]|nr:substrate-binding domain-containing protein [Opitutaceae bacterium]